MIRTVRKASQAREVAIKAISSFVVWEFLSDGYNKASLELGVLPVFAMSLADATTFSFESARRTGWRFICVADDFGKGAIINVRRTRWRKPRFSGYSYGRKAMRHQEIADAAADWSSQSQLDYVARILVVQQANIDLLWLKPIGRMQASRFFLLSSRAVQSDIVPNFVRDTATRKMKISKRSELPIGQ